MKVFGLESDLRMLRRIDEICRAIYRLAVHQNSIQRGIEFIGVEGSGAIVSLLIDTRDLPTHAGGDSQFVSGLPGVLSEISLIVQRLPGKRERKSIPAGAIAKQQRCQAVAAGSRT